jgi:two-component system, chemotaxis family, response regulator PixG
MAMEERIYPISESISAQQLVGVIQQMIQTEVNGCITLDTDYGQQWLLYFASGHLIWASGGEHRWRRWYRLLKQLKIHPKSLPLPQDQNPRLEHDTLTALLHQRRITRKSMKYAIDSAVNEVLFDAFLAATAIIQVSCDSDFRDLPESPVTVMGSYDESIARAHGLLRAWQATDLGCYSPNWSPQLNEEALRGELRSLPEVHQRFLQLLDGTRSIRDLAIKTDKDLPALAKVLSVYRRKDYINLQLVPDRRGPDQIERRQSDKALAPAPSPLALPGNVPTLSGAQAAEDRLILCIDDSEHVCYILEEILKTAGYKVVCVQEAVEAVSTVLRRRPDFIFLDLIMPVVNGYELCKQLRRVSSLKEVPIVILTGKDGMVDRVRAQPINEAEILAMLQRHLPEASSSATQMASPAAA